MEKVCDVISEVLLDPRDFDRKSLLWAFEIKQLSPFYDFIGNLDKQNILTEEEYQM